MPVPTPQQFARSLGGVPGDTGEPCVPLAVLRRHRLPQEQWWLNLRLMLKMLANYQISLTEYISGTMEHVTRRTLSIEKGF